MLTPLFPLLPLHIRWGQIRLTLPKIEGENETVTNYNGLKWEAPDIHNRSVPCKGIELVENTSSRIETRTASTSEL